MDWKRACLVCLIGEDSGSPSRFFHVSCRAAAPRVRRPVAVPDSACCCMLADLILLNLEPPPDLGRSSENSGSVIGDEARPLLECSRLEVVEAVSEMVSLLDAGRFLLIRSSTRGSMASRLKFCHPFWILTLANARRSCSVRVIFETCTLRMTLVATSSGRSIPAVAAMLKSVISRGAPDQPQCRSAQLTDSEQRSSRLMAMQFVPAVW